MTKLISDLGEAMHEILFGNPMNFTLFAEWNPGLGSGTLGVAPTVFYEWEWSLVRGRIAASYAGQSYETDSWETALNGNLTSAPLQIQFSNINTK